MSAFSKFRWMRQVRSTDDHRVTTPERTTPQTGSTTRRAADRPARPPRAPRHHSFGFWIVGYVFAITMAFAGAPAPLLVVYQAQEGFGIVALTVVFAAFPLGVMASLFFAGHLSDRFGRVRVMGPAVLLNLLAGLMFLTWTDLEMLVLARVISGLGVGMLTATATAHMTELHTVSRAAAGRRHTGRRAEVVATAANLGGIGAGMLVSGVLADTAPDPLYTPYLVLLFAMAAGLLLVGIVPETVSRVDEPWRYRPQRVVVPTESRPAYAGALVAGFVGFAMFGVFSGLSGTFLSGQLGIPSHAVAGLVAFAAFGASAAVQVVTGRWRTRAENLRTHFEDRFWCDDLGTYALALDGRKQPCRVRSSNAFCGSICSDLSM
jgi:MFS family permease